MEERMRERKKRGEKGVEEVSQFLAAGFCSWQLRRRKLQKATKRERKMKEGEEKQKSAPGDKLATTGVEN